jgi:hypothetical protein
MAEPKTREEYDTAYRANTKVSGFGLGTSVHYPCPFCAAPDWVVTRILDMEQTFQRPHACSTCSRAARLVIKRPAPADAITFHLVQTAGPDPAPYLAGLCVREGDGKQAPVIGALAKPERPRGN